MTNENRSNLIAGLFIVVAVVGLVATVIFFQGYRPSSQGKRLFLVFDEAPGIIPNSAVLVSGQRVGSVESIEIEQREEESESGRALKEKAIVAVRIEPQHLEKIKVYANADASIATSVFGTSEIVLRPAGANGIAGGFAEIADEAEIPGYSPSSMTSVMTQVEKVAVNVVDITDQIKGMLGDEVLQTQLREGLEGAVNALDQIALIVEDLGSLTGEAKPLIESSRRTMEHIEEIVSENRLGIHQTVNNVRSTTEKANALIDKVETLATSLTRASDEVAALMKTSNDMLGDNRGNINQILANTRDTSAYLRDLAEKLRRDPSIALWGTDEDDNAADRTGNSSYPDELELARSGQLPARERD